jgi:NhaP-type Na+/H+ or K+/H+ antiporter
MSLYHAAIALAFGMIAQAVAIRFKLPAIVLLLFCGVAIGPDALQLLDPSQLGDARATLVSLAVAVILFEGGLGLQMEYLRQRQRSLGLLLTLGAAISMVTGTLAARYFLDMPWSTATLYGSLMIVTGPTVVTPLLARLSVDRTVRDILVSEGVLIDPIGAIVAIVALEYVLEEHGIFATGGQMLLQLGIGGLAGAFAGITMSEILRRRLVSEELWNPIVLASVVMFFALANRIAGGEAGLMTAVVQGMWMANTGIRELGKLRQFNEEMTVLLLSFIFVLLAANLPLQAVRDLGWGALAVVAAVIWIGRPLSALLCTIGSELSWGQRLFIAWVCPRGIVAASVAGLFGILLNRAGREGGTDLEALVFVTVAVTVTLQGLTVGTVARLLGVDLPALTGTIVVGADSLGQLIARLLILFERQVVLIDRNPVLCRRAQKAGIVSFTGDAMSREFLEEAGARYVDTVLAATTNTSLNTLVGARFRSEYRAERVLVIQAAGESGGDGPRPFPGKFPGPIDANQMLQRDSAALLDYAVPEASPAVGKSVVDLSYGENEFAVLLIRRELAFIASTEQRLQAGDRLVCVALAAGNRPLSDQLELRQQLTINELELLRPERPPEP